jgi:phospholipid transport system substrate-binding protein
MHLAPSRRSVLAAALAGLAVLVAGTPVFAGPATDRLREFFGTINAVLNDPATQSQPLEKVARIKRLVTDIADVRGAAAAVLDREWEARTPTERDEFTRLFAELLERGMVARLAGTVSPVNGMVMSWRGESRAGEEARVMTVVESRDGRKITVEYHMTERRGRWLVRDVVVDGVSTIENYRSQFKRLLRQGSYAALVAQLRAKLGEETLMFAQAAPPTIQAPAAKPAEVATRPAAPRVVARVPAPAPAIKALTPSGPPATSPAAPAPLVATPPLVAKAVDAPVAKRAASPLAKSAAPPVRVASMAPNVPRASRVAPGPAAPPAADVLSPIGEMDVTTHLVPSMLLLMLGFAGVSGAVYLRRRASANVLVLQRFRDRDKRLVLVHPVPRVAKVREGRRKRRVVPPPRNPARHVDDAHGA